MDADLGKSTTPGPASVTISAEMTRSHSQISPGLASDWPRVDDGGLDSSALPAGTNAEES